VIIISGIKDAKSAADVTKSGLLLMKTAMLVLPLICILAGYLIYRCKYKIDSKMYQSIIKDLEDRGDMKKE
jgi:melibiose permease/lactose/raffinose/galactose permease